MARIALVAAARRDIGAATARLAGKRGYKSRGDRMAVVGRGVIVAGAVLPVTGVP
jgi:hypothetical protein